MGSIGYLSSIHPPNLGRGGSRLSKEANFSNRSWVCPGSSSQWDMPGTPLQGFVKGASSPGAPTTSMPHTPEKDPEILKLLHFFSDLEMLILISISFTLSCKPLQHELRILSR